MTIEEMISRYDIRLASHPVGNLEIRNIDNVKRDNALQTIKDQKSEILADLNARAEATRKAEDDRNAKIAAIEGLKEIESAIEKRNAYKDEFNRRMENGSSVLPAAPTESIAELKARYPRAAAYLVAEGYTIASNYAKSSAGNKAIERIINGEDYTQVLADMEKEWSDYCEKHLFD